MRLLLVEDYLLVALALRAILEDSGHIIIGIAPTPDKALRIAKDPDSKLDLALVDIRLENGTSGIDAARDLGEMDVPSIFVTAYSKDVVWTGRSLGVLYKPYSVSDIQRTLMACERLLNGLPAGDHPAQFVLCGDDSDPAEPKYPTDKESTRGPHQ